MPIEVEGATVDDETRCEHWQGEGDVVAFKFGCCGRWYPCRACHDEAVDHPTRTWGPGDLDVHAVLCGACSSTMTVDAYVACEHVCPYCGAGFNPGCKAHWDRYFTLEPDDDPSGSPP